MQADEGARRGLQSEGAASRGSQSVWGSETEVMMVPRRPLHTDAQAGVLVRGAWTPGRAEGARWGWAIWTVPRRPPTTALHPDAAHHLFLREPPGKRRFCFRELAFLSQ